LNHEDLQRVSALDPLTGVYNRRFGLQRLTEEFGRSIRSSDPLGVLMLDLDHFKAVNDTYGHVVGDRVLQTVVFAVRQVLREGDVLMRYGGEEFVIVLPGAGRDDLVQMAERVRRAVSEAEIIEAGQRIPVTVSIGGSGLPDKNINKRAGPDPGGRRRHVLLQGIRTRPLRRRLTNRQTADRRPPPASFTHSLRSLYATPLLGVPNCRRDH